MDPAWCESDADVEEDWKPSLLNFDYIEDAYSVKQKLNTSFDSGYSESVGQLLEPVVVMLSEMAWNASLFFEFYILWLLSDINNYLKLGHKQFNETFFQWCLSVCDTKWERSLRSCNNVVLLNAIAAFRELRVQHLQDLSILSVDSLELGKIDPVKYYLVDQMLQNYIDTMKCRI
jgi:hypothetical protein